MSGEAVKCRRCPADSREGRTLCERCRDYQTRIRRNWLAKLRDEALAVYGAVCVCCGEAERRFLTFDHKNDDGFEHRRDLRTNIYKWLKEHGYPDTFQVLCANCNMGRSWNGGVCPHR